MHTKKRNKEAQQRKACKEYAAFKTTLSLLNVALNDHFPEAMQKKPWEQNRAEEQLDQDDLDEKQRGELDQLPEQLHFLIKYIDSPYYEALKVYKLVELEIAHRIQDKRSRYEVINELGPYCAEYTARFKEAINLILDCEVSLSQALLAEAEAEAAAAAEVYDDHGHAGEDSFDSEKGSGNVHDFPFEHKQFPCGFYGEAGAPSDYYPARAREGSLDFPGDFTCFEKEFEEQVDDFAEQYAPAGQFLS